MMANLEALGGLYFSQRVLLALIQKGLSREAAYKIVQSNAMAVWEDIQKGKAANFQERLSKDKTIRKKLPPGELAACFDLKFYLRHARTVWKRVRKGK